VLSCFSGVWRPAHWLADSARRIVRAAPPLSIAEWLWGLVWTVLYIPYRHRRLAVWRRRWRLGDETVVGQLVPLFNARRHDSSPRPMQIAVMGPWAAGTNTSLRRCSRPDSAWSWQRLLVAYSVGAATKKIQKFRAKKFPKWPLPPPRGMTPHRRSAEFTYTIPLRLRYWSAFRMPLALSSSSENGRFGCCERCARASWGGWV
jgi:hypothetical protein